MFKNKKPGLPLWDRADIWVSYELALLIKNDISNNISIDLSSKENVLTFSSPLTRTTNTIGINLTNYSTTGNDINYLLKTGGTMSGLLTVPNITLGSNGKINSYDDYHYIQISQPTDTLTIQCESK